MEVAQQVRVNAVDSLFRTREHALNDLVIRSDRSRRRRWTDPRHRYGARVFRAG
jgi:hypothetical protein